MRKLVLALVAIIVVVLIGLYGYGERHAAYVKQFPPEPPEPAVPQLRWSFAGPFGTFDRAALQRGFQVYDQVCARCHSLNLLHYGDLGTEGPGGGIGYSEEDVTAIAATKQVNDINEQGDTYQRPGRPADKFVAPFANLQQAKTALNGAVPPDLSVIINAREDGANYLHALLTGYKDPPPAGFKLAEGASYDEFFPGHQIAMPPPLAGDDVTYADGTKATVDQEAHDVTTFLAWATEPLREERKRTGVKVLIFLVAMTGVLYFAKRQIWSDLH
jgi:ubiquinol-cytochrome c reductase cytochrome c1 subunit